MINVTDRQIEHWRADTPGCAIRVHLNNAGASLMPRTVQSALFVHLEREGQIGGYEAAAEAEADIAASYAHIGRLIGSRAGNVAVVENATVAVAQALSAFDFKPGDRIVTSVVDYPSNQIMYLALARRLGVEIVRAADLPEGGIDPDSVADLLKHPRVRLVAVSWVPTNSGVVQDVEAVGAVCARAGMPYLVDGCQAVGQLPIDVERLQCDFLATTARKFLRGPRGIGFLYVSDRMLAEGRFPLYVDMRGADWVEDNRFELAPDARRFENWEFAYALVLAMGEAARYANEAGVAVCGARAGELAAYARSRLAALPGVRVLDRGRTLCAIATAEIPGWHAEALKSRLRIMGVNTSASLREDGVIDMDAKGAASVLRVSPHYFNTTGDVDALIDALNEIGIGH